MVELLCLIVGEPFPFVVELKYDNTVAHLSRKIKEENPDVVQCAANQLSLYVASDGQGWLHRNKSNNEYPNDLSDFKKKVMIPDYGIDEYFDDTVPVKGVVHVLVEVPAIRIQQLSMSADSNKVDDGEPPSKRLSLPHIIATSTTSNSTVGILESTETCIWLGRTDSDFAEEGINLSSEKTLLRSELTTDIINRLQRKNVVLVKSPPMTGKTSMSALVSQALVEKHKASEERMVIFNFSGIMFSDFTDFFKSKFEVTWGYTVEKLTKHRIVYVIVDETQTMYQDLRSPEPSLNSTVFWNTIKVILADKSSRIKVLMFSAYGSNVQYTQLSTPVKIADPEALVGIQHLHFTTNEVVEYVIKWFDGISTLQNTDIYGKPALDLFCSNLEFLTGRHVGLCTTAISSLNKEHSSNVRSSSPSSTALQLIKKLQDGSLFKDLRSSRSVGVLNTLENKELNELEKLFRGRKENNRVTGVSEDTITSFVQKGILIESENNYDFSSPVMKQFFFEKIVGHIERASIPPADLRELVCRVISTIDYSNMKETLGRSVANNIPLERSWQMEFCKAVQRSTPTATVTSADVGPLFGSSGFIDFTLNSNSNFWGIELLREGIKLKEHVKRFERGGRYDPIPFDDYCVIDFRSDENTSLENIKNDLDLSNRLFIVCYDAEFTKLVLYDSTNLQGTIIPTQK